MEIIALFQGTKCSAYLKIGRNEIKGLQTNLVKGAKVGYGLFISERQLCFLA